MIGLIEPLKGTDWMITGEGSIHFHTAFGKTPGTRG
jgi:glycerate kinase